MAGIHGNKYVLLFILVVIGSSEANYGNLQLLARRAFPVIELKPYNTPSKEEVDMNYPYAADAFPRLLDYYKIMNGKIREPHNPVERKQILTSANHYLFEFIDLHIKDLKRLLIATDTTLLSMVMLKLTKKMDTSEMKIRSTQAKIPFGIYVSPEFNCIGTAYYIVSAFNQEDAQMILSSERKPQCYNWRATFAFGGYYHRQGESTYVGPHAEQFQTRDMSQGLYCASLDSLESNHDMQCVYKINPREEFPESVEYEPKVSYICGPYRYFIPTTTDIRCIFSVFSMNFILRFGYDGVTYKSSDLNFMYQNGQVFYTDEPWAGMSCWNWACKWRHNQNQRGNEFFVD